MVKVLVCGGRNFANSYLVLKVLDALSPTEICHGGASGADSRAGAWAESKNVPCRVFPADWKSHGRGAGPRRNQQMLEEFKPDFVVAFEGGAGTADMVKRATSHFFTVLEVR